MDKKSKRDSCGKKQKDFRGMYMRKKIILSGVFIIVTIGAIATRIGDFSAETNILADDIEDKPYE
ncbi:MAG: hypothetical protein IJ733_06520, partial [Lachnospiraceae bacterium]|nr:hypothetical protein [Lachnospiraceae bacterium]